MNKYQAEVEKQLLANEKEVLQDLKNNYAIALKDVKERIKDLQSSELTQSKIYQIQYQQTLEKQLQAITDLLSADNVRTISDYLVKAHNDSFIGTLYNMQKEGVPFIMPINQETVLKSITKKTEDFQLSKTLYKNADELKKTIRTEITRGISQGSSYSDITRNITLNSEADLKKAYRIARTEGGRVQAESKYEAMLRAKANGADIVKQWDSTMDNKTRPTHVALDGQIQELEDPFVVGGHEAMHPHGFGIASEDVNCRCALLERARWAVEDEKNFTKVIDGDIIEFKDAKDYEDFKEKYFSFYAAKDEKTEFKEASTTLEALKRIENALGCSTKIASFSLDALNEELRAIEDFTRDFPDLKGYIQNFWREDNPDAGGSFGIYNKKGSVINVLKMQNYTLDDWNELIKTCEDADIYFKGTTLYSTQIHELAHAIDSYMSNYLKDNYMSGKYIGTINDGGTMTADKFTGHISPDIIRQAKEEVFGTTAYESIKDKISYLGTYAQSADTEMFAQCMAYEYSGQTSEFTARVKELFIKKIEQIKELKEIW